MSRRKGLSSSSSGPSVSFDDLSNDELRQLMLQLKLEPGPITKDTRAVHEKNLKNKASRYELCEKLTDGELLSIANSLSIPPPAPGQLGRKPFERRLGKHLKQFSHLSKKSSSHTSSSTQTEAPASGLLGYFSSSSRPSSISSLLSKSKSSTGADIDGSAAKKRKSSHDQPVSMTINRPTTSSVPPPQTSSSRIPIALPGIPVNSDTRKYIKMGLIAVTCIFAAAIVSSIVARAASRLND